MSDDFDPYLKWLAIPPAEQPPNHYRLLALPLFMDEPDVIENAADQRMGHLRTFASGKNSELSQRILNEVAAAKVCLLSPEKKSAYDATLRAELAPQPQPTHAVATPVTPAGVAVPSAPARFEPLQGVPTSAISASRAKQSPPLWRQPLVAIAAVALVAVAILMVVITNRPPATDVARSDQPPATSPPARPPAAPPAKTPGIGLALPKPGDQEAKPKPPTRPPATLPKPTPTPPPTTPQPKPSEVKPDEPEPAEPNLPKPEPSVPAEPSPAVAPTTETTSPSGEGKFALELPGSHVLTLEGTANLTALDQEFTIESWIRWPEDAVPGMSLMGNRTRQRIPANARLGEWNLWFMAPVDKPQGQVALQYFLNEKQSHQMGARPKMDSSRDWHHLAFSRSADRYWLCFNGQVLLEEELSVVASPDRSTYGDFFIGNGRGFFRSNSRSLQVSAVRLSRGARYRQAYTPPRTFEVDETSLAVLDFTRRLDGRVEDLSSHQHHGTFDQGAWVDLSE